MAGITFDVWTGATTVDMQRFDLGTGLPATAIIDRDGSVAFRIVGVISEEELRVRLDWLLGPRSAVAPVAPVEVDSCCAHDEEADHHVDGHDDSRGDSQEDGADHAVASHDDHGHARDHDHGDADVSAGDASLVPS